MEPATVRSDRIRSEAEDGVASAERRVEGAGAAGRLAGRTRHPPDRRLAGESSLRGEARRGRLAFGCGAGRRRRAVPGGRSRNGREEKPMSGAESCLPHRNPGGGQLMEKPPSTQMVWPVT
ncbi:hypothetical protein HerbRD11066_16340 [Herbidospora sp. RD11066]